MNTQVSILHQDYSSGIRELVEEKLLHLDRFEARLVSVRALLERVKGDHRVEIVANVGTGAVLVADVVGSGFMAALDESLERMTSQLKRHHDKTTIELRRRGRSA